MLVNLGELASYDSFKQALLRRGLPDSTLCHFLASVGSGFVSSLCSTPADVVKTRRMMAAAPGTAVPRGALRCGAQILRTEGPRALYKGFFPTWARLGPWQLVFWVSYERLRRAAGLAGF
eukprot:TRINITY_DN8258_c0_g1_i1.p2 TRINITY_DN8258_c0_g1~~TRINITY_DN8258_c0_g1_i1.p2  ORF type:complete len:120 (-),score=41.84 TRINITY_DN8258_c0_g1_i1:52-411(-)